MVNKQNKSDEILERFNHTFDKWINALDDYTLEALQSRPSPSEWSLGQVYMHLIADTDFYTDQIRGCLASNGADNDKGMPNFAIAIFANNAFPDVQLNNPNNDINSPQPQSVEKTKAEMQRIRDAINNICAQHDLANVAGKTGHPGFGYFTAIEWLQFGEMHTRHHLRQKQRIDESLANYREQE